MIKGKCHTVEHLQGFNYKVTISKTVDEIANAILALSRIDEDFSICKADFEKDSGNLIIIVRALGDQQDKCTEDVERFLADFIEQAIREKPDMVSHKDHELIEGVLDELTKFYEEDEKNHAVFLLLMDKKTEHINGCILGERNNIRSGIAHSLRRDDKLLMDIAEVTQTLLLEGAIDALNEIKDKSKK